MLQDALPLYLQIADELRRNIEESVFNVGDQLPIELELSKTIWSTPPHLELELSKTIWSTPPHPTAGRGGPAPGGHCRKG